MAMTRTASRLLAISFCAALAGNAACAQGERPAGEARASLDDDLPVPPARRSRSSI
jgi:hypothetical protein